MAFALGYARRNDWDNELCEFIKQLADLHPMSTGGEDVLVALEVASSYLIQRSFLDDDARTAIGRLLDRARAAASSDPTWTAESLANSKGLTVRFRTRGDGMLYGKLIQVSDHGLRVVGVTALDSDSHCMVTKVVSKSELVKLNPGLEDRLAAAGQERQTSLLEDVRVLSEADVRPFILSGRTSTLPNHPSLRRSAPDKSTTPSSARVQVLPVSDLRNRFAEILNAVEAGSTTITVTSHREAVAQLVVYNAEKHAQAETAPRKRFRRNMRTYLDSVRNGHLVRVLAGGAAEGTGGVVFAPPPASGSAGTQRAEATRAERLREKRQASRDRRLKEDPAIKEKRLDVALNADEREKLELVADLSAAALRELLGRGVTK